MSRRAEQVDETRQRIVEGAMQLHGSVGPAETTIAAIAERAGVTRLTVYRHFPTDTELFEACSAHWLSQQRLPAPETWASTAEPLERLRAGLTDLYSFYRAGSSMLTNIYRDMAALPEQLREFMLRRDAEWHDLLAKPFRGTATGRRRKRALIGHAVLELAFAVRRPGPVRRRGSRRDGYLAGACGALNFTEGGRHLASL